MDERGRRTSETWISGALLLTSLLVSLALGVADVDVVQPGAVPWIVLVTAALVTVRWHWLRRADSERERLACFWATVALGVVAVLLSPVFALYLFIGYYEVSRFGSPTQRIAGTVAIAHVVAFGQLGGRASPIFQPTIYLGFVGVNLAIALAMLTLDRRREELLVDLAAANAELRAERARSAALLDQNVAQAWEAGVTEERQRLSREIHDTVAQDLVAIISQLGAAADATDDVERERRLAVADSAARDALAEARRAVRALASPRLDVVELPLALDDLLGEWRAATGLAGELQVRGRARASGHDDALLRVVQEALANVTKHARARRADVELSYTDEAVRLEVRDDGVGFDPQVPHDGFGLPGMRARLALAGGQLRVHSAPGGPTTVCAQVPAVGAGNNDGNGAARDSAVGRTTTREGA